jgi:type VI secretion system secreted protein VgrG
LPHKKRSDAMAYQEERRFTFQSHVLPEETFSVVSFKGIEGISRLYEFDITLVSDDPDIDIGAVLKNGITFKILHEDVEEVFHGIPAFFELLREVDEKVFYRTLLVPRLWMSDQEHENQLFLDKSVPDVIEEIFKQAGLSSADYDFKLTGSYRSWEYICQYRETDFNFISRWMEREGIYYFFQQTDAGEKIIVTDKSMVHEDIATDSTIYYSPPSALLPTEEEAIEELVCRQTRLPKKVVLKDYNYRKPSLEMTGEAMVDPNSRATVYIYGEHFKTPEEGNALARIRAEEILCREKVFFGQSTAPALRSGFLFTLEDHYRDSCNQKYLILEVEHEGRQTGYMVSGFEEMMSEEEEELVYRNRFMAIPADIQFRPERRAEKPRFYGTMNARIDASGDGKYAEIDEWGRYKVILPFDMTGKGGGKASRWIRMAQPYAGAGFGMHFPLHKGTEVLLTFIDGDPDRPIISVSVPNPETQSPVTGENQTQCVIRTGGGNQIRIEDKDGKQQMRIECPTENSYVRAGAQDGKIPSGLHMNTDDQLTTDVGNHVVTRVGQNYNTNIGGHEYRVVTGDIQREFHSNSHKVVKGNQTEEVFGNKTSTTHGNTIENYYGNKTSVMHGNTDETYVGTKTSYVQGATTEAFLGAKSSYAGALSSEVYGGVKSSQSLAATLENFYGFKMSACAAHVIEEAGTLKFKKAPTASTEATALIEWKCGGSKIVMTPSSITIESALIEIKGGRVNLRGDIHNKDGLKSHKDSKFKKSIHARNFKSL